LASALRATRASAQVEADPAMFSNRPALRVLLGSGVVSGASKDGFVFAGRSYRGTFQRLDDGRVVNLVDLEAYLYSVIPSEMGSRWPAAALQAQSICARTYVLQRSDPRRAYDLVPSQLDQVYTGVAGETPGATAAVDATAGRVLKFGPGFAQVAYSSCCGGHTEASSDAWGGTPIPYLGGVVCTSCTASPNYRWAASLPLESVAAHFSSALASVGELQDLRVTAYDRSGRARAFELIASNGSSNVPATTFRLAVGPRVLRSLLVTSLRRAPDGTQVLVDGGGLGHGVGLCQWGARGMAQNGASAAAILAFYFPGTVLGDLER
jgi:stage II sporulation protein D